MILRLTMGRLLMLSALAVAGCGAEGGQKPVGEAPAEQAGALLASITIQTGHTVEFRELPSGNFVVGENAAITEPSLLEGVTGRSLGDVYRALQPNAEVPAAIVAADGRLQALRAKAPPAAFAPPPEEKPATAPGLKFYNAGQQAWFKASVCGAANTVDCVQGGQWAWSGWHQADTISVAGMVGSEGSNASSLNVYGWNGTQYLEWSMAVPPGTWSNWRMFVASSPQWHRAFIGTTSNALVSLAVGAVNPTIVATQTAGNQFCLTGQGWNENTNATIYMDGNYHDSVVILSNGTVSEQCEIVNCNGSAGTPVTVTAVGWQVSMSASTTLTMYGCQ
jgi:hypothetical protein